MLCSLPRNLRTQTVLLLVDVVGQRGAVCIRREEGHHLAREILRNHDRRVILARPSLLNCLRFTINNPVEILIRTQRGNNLITNIDLQRHQIRLVPLIAIGNCDPKILRIRERIPRGRNVEPRENRRKNGQPQDNDHGDDRAMSTMEISPENSPHGFHFSLPSSVFSSLPRRCFPSCAAEALTPWSLRRSKERTSESSIEVSSC